MSPDLAMLGVHVSSEKGPRAPSIGWASSGATWMLVAASQLQNLAQLNSFIYCAPLF